MVTNSALSQPARRALLFGAVIGTVFHKSMNHWEKFSSIFRSITSKHRSNLPFSKRHWPLLFHSPLKIFILIHILLNFKNLFLILFNYYLFVFIIIYKYWFLLIHLSLLYLKLIYPDTEKGVLHINPSIRAHAAIPSISKLHT